MLSSWVGHQNCKIGQMKVASSAINELIKGSWHHGMRSVSILMENCLLYLKKSTYKAPTFNRMPRINIAFSIYISVGLIQYIRFCLWASCRALFEWFESFFLQKKLARAPGCCFVWHATRLLSSLVKTETAKRSLYFQGLHCFNELQRAIRSLELIVIF